MTEIEHRFPDLGRYHESHPGLTANVGGSYAEAARVCLDRHHVSPRSIEVASDLKAQSYVVHWRPASTQECKAWNNRLDATRDAAYCLALAGAQIHLGLVAVQRAEENTGSDYYLAPVTSPDDPPDPDVNFEQSIRLEVSGTDSREEAAIRKRLREKIDQARKGRSNLPAIAVVVGFSRPCVVFRNVV